MIFNFEVIEEVFKGFLDYHFGNNNFQLESISLYRNGGGELHLSTHGHSRCRGTLRIGFDIRSSGVFIWDIEETYFGMIHRVEKTMEVLYTGPRLLDVVFGEATLDDKQ